MRIRSLLRALVIAVVFCSWLAISNHCALAVLSAKASATEECPMHPKSSKHRQESGLICCKILRADVASAAAKAVAPSRDLSDLGPDATWRPLTEKGVAETQLFLLDTGPPRPLSFAEAVLQRSLLAHAPPSLG